MRRPKTALEDNKAAAIGHTSAGLPMEPFVPVLERTETPWAGQVVDVALARCSELFEFVLLHVLRSRRLRQLL
jgi:hypothetical protein